MKKETVAVARCASYDKRDVEKAVGKIFECCGISRYSFEKILFKPNMLSGRKPEDGVTTNPTVMEAAIRFFRNSRNIMGDSPASVKKPVQDYWEKCGYAKIAGRTETKLVKFNTSFMLELRSGNKTLQVPVTDYIKEFRLINVAKLKTHGLTVLTAAIKNLYGLIPGFHKSYLHSKFVSPFDFSKFLVAFYRAVEKENIAFNIVDAVISMEGNGPASGDLKKTGYIIGGVNAAAVDIACCRLAGVKTANVPYLNIYEKMYGLPEIEFTGDNLVPAKNFKVPGQLSTVIASNSIIKPALSLLGRHFKAIPVIEERFCVKCLACINVCPVNAINENLHFNRKKCINCLCCFEACPHRAINIRKNFIARVFT